MIKNRIRTWSTCINSRLLFRWDEAGFVDIGGIVDTGGKFVDIAQQFVDITLEFVDIAQQFVDIPCHTPST